MDLTPRGVVVRVKGDTTGEEYAGNFKVKPLLSHGEQVGIDALMRDMLGARVSDASRRAYNQANLLAECQMRIIEAPSWWKDSQNGAGLFDDNVLAAVYAAVVKVEEDYKKELKAAAEAAKADIAKVETAAVK